MERWNQTGANALAGIYFHGRLETVTIGSQGDLDQYAVGLACPMLGYQSAVMEWNSLNRDILTIQLPIAI